MSSNGNALEYLLVLLEEAKRDSLYHEEGYNQAQDKIHRIKIQIMKAKVAIKGENK